jgi:hypothetical protein
MREFSSVRGPQSRVTTERAATVSRPCAAHKWQSEQSVRLDARDVRPFRALSCPIACAYDAVQH